MTRFLPLFPLNMVVFPGEKLNLHIFEPRYKQLIQECQTTGITFGIPAYLHNKVSALGTEVKLLNIEKIHPKGEMDIKTEGLRIIRILDFFKQAPNKFYPAGTIEEVPDLVNEDWQLKIKINESIRQLYSILGINKIFMKLPNNYRVFDIAHHLGLTTEQEYQLLQCPDELSRQEMVWHHLQKILPVVLETEKLKERVKMNGHFKNAVPPNF
ncbi:LON peptidase substrate-binding domain-containing protein [Adhaeribacter rhizoryzae]|uniref:Peptidase n=1 Tax=Adhaeribacter rhizoryzae TaxID=2607907 RepID=A0A5M6DN82_9BACT|nr:LON peptidase substrate-binding domain-containing protein [Adhaeribacter rhizoryzae]KAA5547702.1 peptidase [Adhaeribacter rhizoryzae]